MEKPPVGEAWSYEPKWDGFRCVVFKDGDGVYLQSKNCKPLGRYFPDLVASLAAVKAKRFVLDGEIVIPVEGRLSFDELLMRVHPAASRVNTLAAEHPAMYVVFDLLMDDRGKSLLGVAQRERRARLEKFAKAHLTAREDLRVSPSTTELEDAMAWYRQVGGSLDGIIAKKRDAAYRSGERDGMVKVKHRRTADCVVGGFRYASKGREVGSLLLGLYNGRGELDHVGFTSSFTREERARVTAMIEPLNGGAGFSGRAPGGPSRWSTERSTEWEAVTPSVVVEVEYDHFAGDRFRHGTKLVRFRPDKSAGQCTMEQVAARGGGVIGLLGIKGRRRRS